MVGYKETEIYKLLKEAYPDLQEDTLIQIVQDSFKLIRSENADITFSLDTFLQSPSEGNVNNDEWKW